MATTADVPLFDSTSLGIGCRLKRKLIGGCYAKPPLSMVGDVAYTKPKEERDNEMLVRELIHECFTRTIRDSPGAGYPGPGDLLAPLQDDVYSIQVWLDGLDGTLKLLGRGLLFHPDDHAHPPLFIPRGEIESPEYRWHTHVGPGNYASLVVPEKNSPDGDELVFFRIHRNELPRLSNVIRGKGWNIADLDEYDISEGLFPAYSYRHVGSGGGHGKKRKKRRRLVKKYLRGAPAPAPPTPPPPPKKRRRLVKKYL